MAIVFPDFTSKLMVLLQEKPSLECAIDLPFGGATSLYKYDSYHVASSIKTRFLTRNWIEIIVGCHMADDPAPSFAKLSFWPILKDVGKYSIEFKYDGTEKYFSYGIEDITLKFKNYQFLSISGRNKQTSYVTSSELLVTIFDDMPVNFSFYGDQTGIDTIFSAKVSKDLTLTMTNVLDSIGTFVNFTIEYGFEPQPTRISLVDSWNILKNYFQKKSKK